MRADARLVLHAPVHGSEMSESLVSLAEAARRLTEAGDKVDRSSLSRYVHQHAADLKPEERGRATVVNFSLLALHRRTNAKVTNSKPFAEDVTIGVARAKKTNSEWLRIELELGERQGILTVVREVENAAHGAVGAMRNALSNAAGDTAEAIAKALGVEANLVRPHIRAFERVALTAFVRGLTESKVVRSQDVDQAAENDQADAGGAG